MQTESPTRTIYIVHRKSNEKLFYHPDTRRFLRTPSTINASPEHAAYAKNEHTQFWNGLGFDFIDKDDNQER